MTLALTCAAALVLAAVLILVHYQVLDAVARLTRGVWRSRRILITTVMFTVFLGHTLEIAIYAVAYWALAGVGLGGFTGGFEGTALDYFRFSATSFTTLGMGPLQPTGGFGVLSALEALTGFSLITWSATFGYSVMHDLWESGGEEERAAGPSPS